MDNDPGSSRPIEVDSNLNETLIENNQCYTMWEIANILKISKSSIENHLHQLGYVHHSDVWVSCKLTEKKNFDCISASDVLLKCNKIFCGAGRGTRLRSAHFLYLELFFSDVNVHI